MNCTGTSLPTIYIIPSIVFWISRIPVTAKDKNNPLTFDWDTELDDLSKIISFQYLLAINNDNTCNLKSFLKCSLDVAVNHSINAITHSQNTGRKALWYNQVHPGHLMQPPVAGTGTSKPVGKNNSTWTCWRPRSRQKNCITWCNSSK